MSINQQQNGILQQIGGMGGADPEALKQIKELKKSIEDMSIRLSILERSVASEDEAGMVKLSAKTDITEAYEFAVPSRELNPTIPDTLSSRILKLEGRTSNSLDYAGRINITGEFTAPSDGVLYAEFTINTAGEGGIFVNGVRVVRIRDMQAATYTNIYTSTVILSKGDSVTFPNYTLGSDNSIFVPYK